MTEDGFLYLCIAITIGFLIFCVTQCERENQKQNLELEKFKIEHQAK